MKKLLILLLGLLIVAPLGCSDKKPEETKVAPPQDVPVFPGGTLPKGVKMKAPKPDTQKKP